MPKGDPPQPQKTAAASQKPPATTKQVSRAVVKPARMPKSSVSPEPELTSRTTTLDDPMTTSLLAEVSRQRSTIEIRPEDIDHAIAAELEAVAAEREAIAAERKASDAEHEPPDGTT
jgi:hypothetical protein